MSQSSPRGRVLPIPATPSTALHTYAAANNAPPSGGVTIPGRIRGQSTQVPAISKAIEPTVNNVYLPPSVAIPVRRESIPQISVQGPSVSYLSLKNQGFVGSGGHRSRVAGGSVTGDESTSSSINREENDTPDKKFANNSTSVSEPAVTTTNTNVSLPGYRPPTPARPATPARPSVAALAQARGTPVIPAKIPRESLSPNFTALRLSSDSPERTSASGSSLLPPTATHTLSGGIGSTSNTPISRPYLPARPVLSANHSFSSPNSNTGTGSFTSTPSSLAHPSYTNHASNPDDALPVTPEKSAGLLVTPSRTPVAAEPPTTPLHGNSAMPTMKDKLASLLGVGTGRRATVEKDTAREVALRQNNTLFVGTLDHCVEDVHKQVEAGQYLMKRVGMYTERITSAAAKFAEALHAETRTEMSHLEKAGLDQCGQFVAAYRQLQETTMAFANVVDAFAQQVSTSVSSVMLESYKEADARRKQVKADQLRVQLEVVKQQEQLSRSTTKCRGAWAQLVQVENENIRAREILGMPFPTQESTSPLNTVANSGNFVSNVALGSPVSASIAGVPLDEKVRTKTVSTLKKNEKSVLDIRERTQKEFNKCRQEVERVRQAQEKYHAHVIPDVMREFEDLERSRLTKIKDALTMYATLFLKLSESAPLTRKLLAITSELDVQASMHAYVTAMRAENGTPGPYVAAKNELPCPPDAFLNNDWKQYIHVEFGAAAESIVKPLVYKCEEGWAPSSPRANVLVLPKGSYILVSNNAPTPRSVSSLTSTSSRGFPSTHGPNFLSIPTRPASLSTSHTTFDPTNVPSSPIAGMPIDDAAGAPDDLFGELITTPRATSITYPLSDSEPNSPQSQSSLASVALSYSKGCFPSHVVTRVAADESMPLAYILYCPELCKLFKDHLRREYSSENYEFWEAARNFRLETWEVCQNPDGTFCDAPGAPADRGIAALRQRATEIMQEFVFDDARTQVNLRGNVREVLLDTHKSGRAHPLMFVSAEQEIYNLLSQDSLSRFKKTAAFSEYLAKLAILETLQW